jgi:DMSO/TMAO reductase YedYZ molybdopterin-dependent catalytic subunit
MIRKMGGQEMHTKPGRREFLGAAALGTAALAQGGLWAAVEGEKVIPFLVNPPANNNNNAPRAVLNWDQLTSWTTPEDQYFAVQHYNVPEIDPSAWKLEIAGLVSKPRSFSLQDLKARPRKEHILTIECSGNGPAGGLVANEKWTGTPLAPILKEAGIQPAGIEVVFFRNRFRNRKDPRRRLPAEFRAQPVD